MSLIRLVLASKRGTVGKIKKRARGSLNNFKAQRYLSSHPLEQRNIPLKGRAGW
jgi:hypothetical protein